MLSSKWSICGMSRSWRLHLCLEHPRTSPTSHVFLCVLPFFFVLKLDHSSSIDCSSTSGSFPVHQDGEWKRRKASAILAKSKPVKGFTGLGQINLCGCACFMSAPSSIESHSKLQIG
ncbi:MAG: hypothetical protein CL912_03165 [Deltaproteobacteria bacterium]|nr:hypothetical protein [Deltaproteobacteria bacterium]